MAPRVLPRDGFHVVHGAVGLDARELRRRGTSSLSMGPLSARRALHDRDEVHAVVFPANALIDGVLDYADDFEVCACDVPGEAEVVADGVLTGLEQSS